LDKRGEACRQRVGAVNHGKNSARRQQREAGARPVLERRVADMGRRFSRIGRHAHATSLKKRWIRQYDPRRLGRQSGGAARFAVEKISFKNPRSRVEAIERDVFARQLAGLKVKFNQPDICFRRHQRRAKAGGPDARSDVQQQPIHLARRRRD